MAPQPARSLRLQLGDEADMVFFDLPINTIGIRNFHVQRSIRRARPPAPCACLHFGAAFKPYSTDRHR